MSSTDQNQLEERISELIDGTATEQQRRELLELVTHDSSLLEQLAEHLQISELLSQQTISRNRDYVLPLLIDHLQTLGEEPENAFVASIFQRIRNRRTIRNFAIAASLTAILVPLSWMTLEPFGDGPSDSGEIVARANRLDSYGNVTESNNIREGQSFELDEGVMKFRFSNGAVVAIEAPASFKIDSAFQMELLSGKLNAWCPESAHGFKVITEDTTLTDLGTSFGIEASPSGSSDFVVIEGSVNLSKGTESRILNEGSAMKTDRVSGLVNSTFETSPFERTWAMTSGIISWRGAVIPAKPDTPENLSKLRNDDSVMVVPEVQGVAFDEPIIAELTSPGHIEMDHGPTPTQILEAQPERNLHSYLIRVDPESDLRGEEHIHYEGSVTFDRNVIAIILCKSTLEASDERFTLGQWPTVSETPGTPTLRGLEVNWNTSIRDQVTLSEDRRTVSIAFHTGGSTDDIRVITAE